MQQDEFETPDLSEFIASCAKQFCPECGKPIEKNKNGRPRYFCSDRCRWAFNKRAERKKAKEKYEAARTEEHTGEGFEAGSIQPEKEIETGG